MADKIPATFEEARELARQQMLAAQAAADDDATLTQTPPTDEDDDESSAPDPEPDPSDEDEPDDPAAASDDEADEDDDESDDEDDEPETTDDTPASSDDDADDEPEPASPKRKPSRRSKKIEKLQSEIATLRSERETSEERLLQRLQDEQARRTALEAEQRQRDAEGRQIEAEMHEYLGSEQEYQQAVRAALEGDVFAQEKARGWHERREIFSKMTRQAETRVNRKAAEIFWASTGDLPGIDKQILEKSDFGTVLRHLHTAGVGVGEQHKQKEIDKLMAENARLRAAAKEKKIAKVAKAAPTRDPIEGGGPIRAVPQKNPYLDALNPDGTVNREKYGALLAASRRDHMAG